MHILRNVCAADDFKFLAFILVLILVFSPRDEDGYSVGTSPFIDATCGAGSLIRLCIFQMSMSLITVVYWRSSGEKCRHQECVTPRHPNKTCDEAAVEQTPVQWFPSVQHSGLSHIPGVSPAQQQQRWKAGIKKKQTTS